MSCSILKKLFYRETNGTIKKNRHQRNSQFFTKIPTRLCFRLPTLVPEETLEEGHVFLGFSKCGQYIVSYSCTMDADHQSVLPICTYEYRLQWWWFIPNQPLTKISEVKLFAEEELTGDLYISFCEWPQDTSKVLIFGHSLPSQNQDGCWSCYLTITSVPTLQNCRFCQTLYSDDKKEKPIKIPCMKHAFSVHTKFELTPPFPPFGPRTQLKIDGVAVVNTGDSIVALTVCVDGFGEEEKSPIALTEVSVYNDNQTKETLENPKLESVKQYSKGPISPSVCECRRKLYNGVDVCLCPSPRQQEMIDESQKENMDGGHMKEYARQRSPRASYPEGGKYGKYSGPLLSSSQDWFDNLTDTSQTNNDILTSNNSISVMQEVHASGSQLHTIDKDNSPLESLKCLKSPTKCDHSDTTKCDSPRCEHSNVSQKSTTLNCEIIDSRCPSPGPPPSCKSPGPAKSPGLYSPVCSPLQPSPACNNCVYSTKTSSQRSFFSPSNSGTSTTSTSKSADSVYLQVNENSTVTYTVRKFSYALQSGNESPGIVEEDFDLAYRSILPLEVYGDKDKPLLPAHCKEALQECVRVTQMTFDVEHYLEEVIGHYADWGQRYIAFTNYDLQIVDVCAESNTVLGKVFALIHAREDPDSCRKIKKSKNAIRRYQTSFCFTWNLTTGGYDTKFIGDLCEVDECEIRRIESTWKEWKPGLKECALLRRQMYIPQSTQRYVNVLSNESVIKGESLKFIIAPQHYVALLI